MENLNQENAVLSQEIQDNMFVFDNLLAVDDRGIQADRARSDHGRSRNRP